jgi:WD40 repeat protein
LPSPTHFYAKTAPNRRGLVIHYGEWRYPISGEAVFYKDGWGPVAMSPDGKFIVSQDSNNNMLVVWLLATGQEIARMRHDDTVMCIAFSADWNYVVSNANNNTVRIWETFTGKELARYDHKGFLEAVALSPDGRLLLIASEGIIRLRLWQNDDLMVYADATLPRNLTRVEWEQYIGDALPYQAVCEDLPIEPEPTATTAP